MTLKFCLSVAEELKLKVRKFWDLILTFVAVTEEKTVRGGEGKYRDCKKRISLIIALTHFRPMFHLCRNQVVGFYKQNV